MAALLLVVVLLLVVLLLAVLLVLVADGAAGDSGAGTAEALKTVKAAAAAAAINFRRADVAQRQTRESWSGSFSEQFAPQQQPLPPPPQFDPTATRLPLAAASWTQ